MLCYVLGLSGWVSVVCVYVLLSRVVFCKQKTAYDMRISDWSSDVCSSDLHQRRQVEVTDMIDSELHLETLRGAHQRTGHDAGIVDEQMQRRLTVGGRE